MTSFLTANGKALSASTRGLGSSIPSLSSGDRERLARIFDDDDDDAAPGAVNTNAKNALVASLSVAGGLVTATTGSGATSAMRRSETPTATTGAPQETSVLGGSLLTQQNSLLGPAGGRLPAVSSFSTAAGDKQIFFKRGATIKENAISQGVVSDAAAQARLARIFADSSDEEVDNSGEGTKKASATMAASSLMTTLKRPRTKNEHEDDDVGTVVPPGQQVHVGGSNTKTKTIGAQPAHAQKGQGPPARKKAKPFVPPRRLEVVPKKVGSSSLTSSASSSSVVKQEPKKKVAALQEDDAKTLPLEVLVQRQREKFMALFLQLRRRPKEWLQNAKKGRREAQAFDAWWSELRLSLMSEKGEQASAARSSTAAPQGPFGFGTTSALRTTASSAFSSSTFPFLAPPVDSHIHSDKKSSCHSWLLFKRLCLRVARELVLKSGVENSWPSKKSSYTTDMTSSLLILHPYFATLSDGHWFRLQTEFFMPRLEDVARRCSSPGHTPVDWLFKRFRDEMHEERPRQISALRQLLEEVTQRSILDEHLRRWSVLCGRFAADHAPTATSRDCVLAPSGSDPSTSLTTKAKHGDKNSTTNIASTPGKVIKRHYLAEDAEPFHVRLKAHYIERPEADPIEDESSDDEDEPPHSSAVLLGKDGRASSFGAASCILGFGRGQGAAGPGFGFGLSASSCSASDSNWSKNFVSCGPHARSHIVGKDVVMKEREQRERNGSARENQHQHQELQSGTSNKSLLFLSDGFYLIRVEVMSPVLLSRIEEGTALDLQCARLTGSAERETWWDIIGLDAVTAEVENPLRFQLFWNSTGFTDIGVEGYNRISSGSCAQVAGLGFTPTRPQRMSETKCDNPNAGVVPLLDVVVVRAIMSTFTRNQKGSNDEQTKSTRGQGKRGSGGSAAIANVSSSDAPLRAFFAGGDPTAIGRQGTMKEPGTSSAIEDDGNEEDKRLILVVTDQHLAHEDGGQSRGSCRDFEEDNSTAFLGRVILRASSPEALAEDGDVVGMRLRVSLTKRYGADGFPTFYPTRHSRIVEYNEEPGQLQQGSTMKNMDTKTRQSLGNVLPSDVSARARKRFWRNLGFLSDCEEKQQDSEQRALLLHAGQQLLKGVYYDFCGILMGLQQEDSTLYGGEPCLKVHCFILVTEEIELEGTKAPPVLTSCATSSGQLRQEIVRPIPTPTSASCTPDNHVSVPGMATSSSTSVAAGAGGAFGFGGFGGFGHFQHQQLRFSSGFGSTSNGFGSVVATSKTLSSMNFGGFGPCNMGTPSSPCFGFAATAGLATTTQGAPIRTSSAHARLGAGMGQPHAHTNYTPVPPFEQQQPLRANAATANLKSSQPPSHKIARLTINVGGPLQETSTGWRHLLHNLRKLRTTAEDLEQDVTGKGKDIKKRLVWWKNAAFAWQDSSAKIWNFQAHISELRIGRATFPCLPTGAALDEAMTVLDRLRVVLE
ncbi:unnamed protein product [Amoebophrya sp. A25]|nr:unnamed protein product [Amoebophrya sp. A25]|eukprot:GSA25T00020477001.1